MCSFSTILNQIFFYAELEIQSCPREATILGLKSPKNKEIINVLFFLPHSVMISLEYWTP